MAARCDAFTLAGVLSLFLRRLIFQDGYLLYRHISLDVLIPQARRWQQAVRLFMTRCTHLKS